MSLTSAHAGRPADVVKNILERVRTAAGADLDHLGFGDKHSVGPNGQYIQGVPMLARAMAEWPPERPAGLLFLVPLWHPVQMAELIVTLTAISDVPLAIQTGIGAGEQQFAAMGSNLILQNSGSLEYRSHRRCAAPRQRWHFRYRLWPPAA